jgi:hypothetical protein
MGEIPVRRDELVPVLLQQLTVGAGRAQGLAREDEVGDPADQILDSRACRSRVPQRSRHAVSVIGVDQEFIKSAKNFSKLLLS